MPTSSVRPHSLHEGNWQYLWGSLANIVAPIVFLGLWSTGLLLWARRKLRPRTRRDPAFPTTAPLPGEWPAMRQP